MTDKDLAKTSDGSASGETSAPMRRTVPTSTYRLQLHEDFTFDDAGDIAGYLHALGISHVYSSPYLQAAPHSRHGYDVVDPTRVNDELGGDEAHRRFCRRLGEAKLGQVLDIVPNHMAIGSTNRYWWDVLENGESSRYASWFDIDWHPAEVKLQNKVLIPILGDQYGRMLSARKITLQYHDGAFSVHYEDQQLPVAPESVSILLIKAAKYAQDDTLNFVADSFSRLPGSTDSGSSMARHRDKTVIHQLLKSLCEERKEVGTAVAKAVEELNDDIDALDDFLNAQHYRLAFWRTADQELGYRRFFDVNTLIGLRMAREHVFESTHCRILEWLRDGVLDGVRVDHVDGLRDPLQYFERLRARAGGAWIIGEKILEQGEFLREKWPIDGTSGYDFMNVCNNLLVRGDGMKELTQIYGEFTGEPTDFAAVARDKKQNVLHEGLGSDVNRLANIFVEICEKNRDRRDYTRAEIRRAIREVAASFSIYRTYIVPEQHQITTEDREYIDEALTQAKRRQDLDPGLFDFIGDVLTLKVSGELESEFLLRFQQFTSPVMAKGVEDTAFYCFNRMVGLNEVGNDPGLDGLTLAQFHDYCAKMQATHPLTMTTLSTHDTKRSDDVRARLAAISEIPGEWKTVLSRWSHQNSQFRSGDLPDPNTEYFLYQTMIGAWPIDKDRLIAYMEKAMREAKQRTSWTQNNKEFEDAFRCFIEEILESREFVADLENFVERVKHAGRINSLAQSLVKFTAPGVPDTYQGGEIWDLSLVDPDNRRPVDYALRQRMLDDLHGGMNVDAIMRRLDDGMPKLWVVHNALCLRKEHPEWFGAEAAYEALASGGTKSEHLIAYMRGDRVITLAGRWPLTLQNDWAETTVELPQGKWKNRLTGDTFAGGRLPVQTLLERFPVALLTREVD